MILENMSDAEILQNFFKEKEELNMKCSNFWGRRFRRACLKKKMYPFMMFTSFKTKAGNKYYVRMMVKKRSDLKKKLCGVSFSLFLPKDKFPECISFGLNNKNLYYVEHYPAHFMQRYRERMGLEGTNQEMMERYLAKNSLGTYKEYGTDENGDLFTLTTEEGVGYGIRTKENKVIVRTFIPHSDLNEHKTLLQARSLKKLRELKSMNIFY